VDSLGEPNDHIVMPAGIEEVRGFVGIISQVEELAFVEVAEAELPAIGRDNGAGPLLRDAPDFFRRSKVDLLRRLEAGAWVPLDEDVVFGWRAIVANRGHKTVAGKSLARIAAHQVEQRGHQVNLAHRVLDHLLAPLARRADQPRNTCGLFIHDRFRNEVMGAHHVAVVARVNHDRVVGQAEPFKCVEDRADASVDLRDQSPVLADQGTAGAAALRRMGHVESASSREGLCCIGPD